MSRKKKDKKSTAKRKFLIDICGWPQKVYHVDDCTAAQVKDGVEQTKKNGVPVLK